MKSFIGDRLPHMRGITYHDDECEIGVYGDGPYLISNYGRILRRQNGYEEYRAPGLSPQDMTGPKLTDEVIDYLQIMDGPSSEEKSVGIDLICNICDRYHKKYADKDSSDDDQIPDTFKVTEHLLDGQVRESLKSRLNLMSREERKEYIFDRMVKLMSKTST